MAISTPKILTIGRRKITLTVTLAATAQPISTTRLLVPDFEIFAPLANTGAHFYIGNPNVDNTWIPRNKGQYFSFTHGTGNLQGNDPVVEYDLSQIYVAVESNGDSVIVEYNSREKYSS